MLNQTESQIILRRAKEAMEDAKRLEQDAIKELARARKAWIDAKEKYDNLFMEEEMREFRRIKSQVTF